MYIVTKLYAVLIIVMNGIHVINSNIKFDDITEKSCF